MKKTLLILIGLFLIFSLSACGTSNKSKPKKATINYISPTFYNKLKIGMSESQVIKLVGKPTSKDPNDNDMWHYSVKNELNPNSYIILTFDMSDNINIDYKVLVMKEQQGLLTKGDTSESSSNGNGNNGGSSVQSSQDVLKGSSNDVDLLLAAQDVNPDVQDVNIQLGYVEFYEFNKKFQSYTAAFDKHISESNLTLLNYLKDNKKIKGVAIKYYIDLDGQAINQASSTSYSIASLNKINYGKKFGTSADEIKYMLQFWEKANNSTIDIPMFAADRAQYSSFGNPKTIFYHNANDHYYLNASHQYEDKFQNELAKQN